MQRNHPFPHQNKFGTGPVVSINLLTYNGRQYIENCLNSVLRQTYPYIEILVIDNASNDGTAAYLKKFGTDGPKKGPKKLKLRVVFNQRNVGFAVGHNQGIKETQGEFICCLNQDVVLDKNFIKEAVGILEKDGQVAAVQGKLLRMPLFSKIIDTTGLVILKNRRIIARGQGQTDRGQFKKTEEIFGADGAVPVYRRKALVDVKIEEEYFDEDFFCYKEDVDLAWRLRLYGWKAVYQPKAVAWHARTAGDSAAINYFAIIRERLKINKFSKYQSFKNQRLMQLKNEQTGLLLKHLFWFLPKEIASWFYVLLFEKYTWQAIKDLFRQTPRAWQKRKIIMAKKRVGLKEIGKWFQ